MLIAVILPESAAVRVPVQGLKERNDWFVHSFPFFAPLIPWEKNPSWCPPEVSLYVSLFGVCLFYVVTRDAPVGITCLGSLHGSGA